MLVSFSMMDTWMKCPLMAKFKYVDRLPDLTNAKTVYGSVMHRAMETYNTNGGQLDGAIDTFKTMWIDPDTYGFHIDFWPKGATSSGLMATGIESLTAYHQKVLWNTYDVVSVEHHFKVSIGEHQIQGYVDLLKWQRSGRGKDQLVVVDYKTGKTPTIYALKLNVQFTAYMFAVEQPEFWTGWPGDPSFPGLPDGAQLYEHFMSHPRRGEWYSLQQNKALDVGPRDQGDYARMYRVITEITKALEADVFVPNISFDSCAFCAYVSNPCPIVPERPAGVDPDDEDAL